MAYNVEVPYNIINGLVPFVQNNVLKITPGSCASTENVSFIYYDQLLTIDPTVVGQNGIDTGSTTLSTIYSVYFIWPENLCSSNSPAAIISLSVNFPLLPSGYVYYRKIGYAKTTGYDANLFVDHYIIGENSYRTLMYDQNDISDNLIFSGFDISPSVSSQSLFGFIPETSQVGIDYNLSVLFFFSGSYFAWDGFGKQVGMYFSTFYSGSGNINFSNVFTQALYGGDCTRVSDFSKQIVIQDSSNPPMLYLQSDPNSSFILTTTLYANGFSFTV